ncbi:MAG: type II secretion system GspH family protein [Armatimonadetes bacterium]|nr:type II secretion system GspH family protein [Armatimonadota bacterium]
MFRSTWSRNRRGLTLIEIMVVVLVIGILLSIAIPNFVSARDKARLNSCLTNLKRIDNAKDQFAAELKKHEGDAVGWADIVPGYVKSTPACPAGGSYTINPIGENPTCTVAAHVLP